MPAGVSWGQYLRYTAAAMLSMFAGAQTVHMLYRPMDDFDKYLKEALEKEEAALAAAKVKGLKMNDSANSSMTNSRT